MSSLSQILKEHGTLMVLDASSERIQTGLLSTLTSPRWACRNDDAGVGLFACLDALHFEIGSVDAFAYCEGPGSILGIRTSAIALRMWNVLRARPMFAFMSLAVAAQAVGRRDVSLIADARRGQWHRLRMGGVLERVPTAALAGELMMPEGFRHWQPPPPATALTSYDLGTFLTLSSVMAADLFRETTAPDAFLHEEPTYAKWGSQIHRAP